MTRDAARARDALGSLVVGEGCIAVWARAAATRSRTRGATSSMKAGHFTWGLAAAQIELTTTWA
jgi:hypothetical protein